MSFFVRVPSLASSEQAGVYMNGGCRDHRGPCVHGLPATPAELLDNSGKGCDCRLDAVIVSNDPPRFAFYAQSHGVPNWLSYDAASARLGFSLSLGPDETFSVEMVDVSTKLRAIYNPHHQVYLTASDEAGGVCHLRGEKELTAMGHLSFEIAPGTGPLMLGRRYFIKSIFGTVLGVDGRGGLGQHNASPDGDACVEFTAEQGYHGPHTPDHVHCYRFRSDKGQYVAMSAGGQLYMSEDRGASDPETSFQLAPDTLIVGNFRIVDNARFRCIRADIEGPTVSTASSFRKKACDTFGFQAVEAGPSGALLGPRVAAVWPKVCTREHARLNIDLGAGRAAAAAATGCAPVACGGRVPPMPTATHAALALSVPACAVPPMPVARSEMDLWHGGEGYGGYHADGKGAAGEVMLPLAGGPGALPTRGCSLVARLSNRWVLLALVLGLVVAALFVAQVVVRAHGGRVPRISWA